MFAISLKLDLLEIEKFIKNLFVKVRYIIRSMLKLHVFTCTMGLSIICLNISGLDIS